MFGTKRVHEISLGHVHDTIRVREGDETLTLTVEADPDRIIAGLRLAQDKLMALNKDSSEEEYGAASAAFAEAIFGPKQAAELLDFYHGDATCVINVSSRYFNDRLKTLITKEQKRRRRAMEK